MKIFLGCLFAITEAARPARLARISSLDRRAFVGAAAFSAVVTGKISIAVVVFELTGQLSFAIPVLLAVVVAHTIGGYFSAPIYDRIAINKAGRSEPSVASRPKMAKETDRECCSYEFNRPV